MGMFRKNRHQTIAVLLVIIVAAALVVDIVIRAVEMNAEPTEARRPAATGTPEGGAAKEPLESYAVIMDRNLLRTADRPIVPDQMDPDTLEATTLQLELYGTVAGEGGKGYAVIEERDRKRQRVYTVGDSVGGATLIRIMRNAVVLRIGDRDEVLRKKEISSAGRARMELPGPTAQPAPGESSPPKPLSRAPSGAPAGSAGDLANLLSQARVIPHITAGTTGKPDGVVISEIQAGSLFEAAGLVNGDVIQEVNGKPVTGVGDLVALYRDVKPGATLSVKVTRTGRQVVLNHTVQ